MKKIKKSSAVLGLSLALLGIGGVAQASYTFSSFNLTVPKINGSAYTAYQTMASDTSGEEFDVIVDSVGGGYKVDLRVNYSDGRNSSWVRDVSSGYSKTLTSYYPAEKGTKTRLQFSNDLTTYVDVQVKGKWRNN